MSFTLIYYLFSVIFFMQEEITRLEKNDEEMNQNVFDESLASNMYIFDTVFCRRCLEFNCRLHGTGQPVIFPVSMSYAFGIGSSSQQPKVAYFCLHEYLQAERLEGPVLVSGQDEKPCSNQCYKRSYEDSTIGADPGDSARHYLKEYIVGFLSCYIAFKYNEASSG
ncbi:putative [histone H3]-lysine(4) N-trimethyltransferase [Helianthus annuus]|nr:putative [histone H3]-lysine(4) N-trimethyltransferase [Helianthus annuus]